MMRYLAIIAVIVVAGGVAWQQSHQPQRAVGEASEAALQQWPQITPAQVHAIVLHHQKQTVQLSRHGDNWMVSDLYGEVAANQDLITRLLHDTTAMQPQRVISTNPDNFSRFRLTDSADRLTLKDEKGVVLLDLLIGKPGTDLISTTVRRMGENTIFNINRSLAWQVGRSPSGWRAASSAKSMPAKKAALAK